MNFGVAVGEGKAGGGIMIVGGLIDPTGLMRIEKSCVVDAVRVFIQVNPGFAWAGKEEIRSRLDVFVDGFPRAAVDLRVGEAPRTST